MLGLLKEHDIYFILNYSLATNIYFAMFIHLFLAKHTLFNFYISAKIPHFLLLQDFNLSTHNKLFFCVKSVSFFPRQNLHDLFTFKILSNFFTRMLNCLMLYFIHFLLIFCLLSTAMLNKYLIF